MESRTLHDLLVFLETESSTGLSPQRVTGFLQESTFEEEQFLPFLFFSDEHYARNLIHKCEEYELIALTWLPGQKTAVHDHGDSHCWTFLLSGQLSFQNYAEKKGKLLTVGDAKKVSAGEFDYVTASNVWHSIANESTKPAVSIHLYATPITECRVWKPETKSFEIQELSYFTQVGEEVPEVFPRQ